MPLFLFAGEGDGRANIFARFLFHVSCGLGVARSNQWKGDEDSETLVKKHMRYLYFEFAACIVGLAWNGFVVSVINRLHLSPGESLGGYAVAGNDLAFLSTVSSQLHGARDVI